MCTGRQQRVGCAQRLTYRVLRLARMLKGMTDKRHLCRRSSCGVSCSCVLCAGGGHLLWMVTTQVRTIHTRIQYQCTHTHTYIHTSRYSANDILAASPRGSGKSLAGARVPLRNQGMMFLQQPARGTTPRTQTHTKQGGVQTAPSIGTRPPNALHRVRGYVLLAGPL